MFYEFIIKYTHIFFAEKMREAFAMQKVLDFLNKKYWCFSDINVWSFNESLTNDIISFEQLSHVWEIAVHLTVAGDVSDGVFLCCPFSNEMSWLRS